MLSKEEAKATLQFLDRVSVTGHQERFAMNQITEKLANIADPAPMPAPIMEPAEVPPTLDELYAENAKETRPA